MTYSYLTISEAAEILYKEKGSKFITFAYPTENEEDIKQCLDFLRKKYFDATHHCYAYSLGYAGEKTRSQDDGEPSGTAGLPILNQIRSKKLTNILVVVVRYFGGTKLGASGLVNAYKTSAGQVLEQTNIIERFVIETLELRFDYLQINAVMRVLKNLEAKILEQNFDNQCFIRLRLKLQHKEILEKSIDFAQIMRVYE